jgi:hypothetical protein
MKNALKLIAVFVVSLLGLSISATAQTGCPGQDPYNCAGCTNDSTYRFRVCIGPVTDTIDVTMCTQFATTQLVSNPCTNCTRPLDAITWVRRVCVPPSLALVSIDTIYRAIIARTSLCCGTPFIPAAFPKCDSITGTCNPIQGVYCHIVALPKCIVRIGNCWQPCTQQCRDFCYVERRYCRATSGACTPCSSVVCSTPDPCSQGCTIVDCNLLLNPLGCCP